MSTAFPNSGMGDPPWEIATLFPPQGRWSEHDYLLLSGNHLVEFSRGFVEVLPMPTELHQLLLVYLLEKIKQHVEASNLGKALPAPLRVRLSEETIREPDIVFLKTENFHLRGEQFWQGADLVVEIISPSDPQRDLVTKRAEYATAAIAEYWIVDPRDQSVTLLTLADNKSEYTQAGKVLPGGFAASLLLPGLEIDVNELFSQS